MNQGIKVVKIALLGLGTVGSGVYKLIEEKGEEFEKRTGAKIQIEKILVHNLKKERPGVKKCLLTDQWKEIIENDEIELVIEVMGGIEPAKAMILEALNAGKNVVTANKDLVAEHGKELFEAAERNQKDFLFEAAVAGGIPIIRPLKQCLAGNEISDVIGIVNGTTNYILTKMCEEGMDFQEALAKATELGYAEADPTVYTEGITKITAKDIAYAKEFDSVIKLLGAAHNTEKGIEVAVYPMMISNQHPLASVRDSFNAVFVHGDAVDDAMFYGRGAGELPTASAIVGDVLDVVRNMEYRCTGRIGCGCYRETQVKSIADVKNKFFLRMQVANQPGVLASIANVFGKHKVSIERIIQKDVEKEKAELVIVTEYVKEGYLQEALDELMQMPILEEISSKIRVY